MVGFTAGPRAARAGHRVHDHDRLDSTSSEALRLARDGDEILRPLPVQAERAVRQDIGLGSGRRIEPVLIQAAQPAFHDHGGALS